MHQKLRNGGGKLTKIVEAVKGALLPGKIQTVLLNLFIFLRKKILINRLKFRYQ